MSPLRKSEFRSIGKRGRIHKQISRRVSFLLVTRRLVLPRTGGRNDTLTGLGSKLPSSFLPIGHQLRVSRGVEDGVVDEVKTEYSEDELPLDPDLATVLLNWKERCPKSEAGRMFPSSITGPFYRGSPIRQNYIRPAGRKLGVAGTPSAAGIAPGSTRLALRWVCSRG
jgi:hypothetical protein